MPASHQAPVQLEPLTSSQILSTESTWIIQTLQKTVVLLDVHLSLPEANPFMVYLNKVKSRGRNIPDPKGFGFLLLGCWLKGIFLVFTWSFCNPECLHCLGIRSVTFLRRFCVALCNFLAWYLCFFHVYKIPSHRSLQWALLGLPWLAAWWQARRRDTGTWSIIFPGAPPHSPEIKDSFLISI